MGSGRLSITRKSKAYRQKLLKRFVLGIPLIAAVGWEYRVWKRRLYYTRNRGHFPGSTPFYGKMWGYESDYMIETFLNDGDMVFWAVDPLSIHIHEAICRFPYRHLKGDYDSWDLCGIVKKVDGRVHVIGPNGVAVLYSDLVADHRTTSLAIRRLVDTSAAGESRKAIASSLRVSTAQQNVDISPWGFAEYSIKALVQRFFDDRAPAVRTMLLSMVREDSMSFPFSLVKEKGPEVSDISDAFIDPLINKSSGTSYSPPFFVRRFDNEYYNHNRTKNIVVDWDLLTQRDLKNRIVSEHQQKDESDNSNS
jgi:hypothetical protein